MILKEIGSLMENTGCEKASPSNCYIKSSGLFLPLPAGFSFPDTAAYRQDYKSKTEYVLLNDEIKNSPVLEEYLLMALKSWFNASR